MTSALRTVWRALRQGLRASRRYQRLRSSGIAHDAALRTALGVPLPPPDVRLVPPHPSCARTRRSRTDETVGCREHDRLPGAARIANLAYVA